MVDLFGKSEKMKSKSFAVLGLGKFGSSVAREMAQAGAQVLAVDCNEERVQEISSEVECAVKADICDVDTMETLGLSNMDGVVVAITGDLNASIMGIILAKEAGVKFILAKASDEMHVKIFEKVGADRVVIPEKEFGIRIARTVVTGNFLDFVELSDRVRLVEIPVKEEWVGSNLMQLDLRRKYMINVVAIREKDHELRVDFTPETPLAEGTSLYVTVDRNNISKLL